MDAGTIGALGTVLAFVAFLGVVFWAYSKRRKSDFEAAARLPLEEEEGRDGGTGERR